MNLREAIEVLEYHQDWRLGMVDEIAYKPSEITEALDILLASVKSKQVHSVRKVVMPIHVKFR